MIHVPAISTQPSFVISQNSPQNPAFARLFAENPRISAATPEKLADSRVSSRRTPVSQRFLEDLRETQAKAAELLRENARLNGLFEESTEKISRLLQENRGLREQLAETRALLREISAKTEAVALENDQLSTTVREQFKELAVWKEKSQVLSRENREFVAISEETRGLASKNQELEGLVREIYEENARVSEESRGFREKVELLLGENSKLTDFCERIREENEGLRNSLEEKLRETHALAEIEQKIELLVRENGKLNKSLLEKAKELEYWKQRYFGN